MKKVLLIDDEYWFSEPIIDRLEALDFNVDFTRTVGGSINKIIKNDYDFIITDCMLPLGKITHELIKEDFKNIKIPGIQLILALKNKDFQEIFNLNRNIKILLYTAIDKSIIFEKANSENINIFIKGTDDDQLMFEYLIKYI